MNRENLLNEDSLYNLWCKAPVETLADKSMIIAMEELAELQQAISKGLRGKLDNDNLHEEVADVLIILEWVKHYFKMNDLMIDGWKYHKQKRIEERMLKGELS